MDVPILYEDSDIVAVAKPAGLVTHSDGRTKEETAEGWFKSKYSDCAGGYVHRLDRDTSGVLVFAKNIGAYEFLRKAFHDREVHKTYLAFVYGVPKEKSGVIDFDNAYRGPLLLDLAKSMVWFGLDRNHFSVKNARDIYRGYVSSQKLTMLEYKELYRMLKFAFASHLYVDFYMKAIGKIPASYFNFLMNDFYGAYKHFSSTCDEKEFYSFLERR